MISNKKTVSQPNSDLLSKRTKLTDIGTGTALLELVGLRAASDLDNMRGQVDHRNRTAWNYFTGDGANGTHVNVISVNTEVSDSTKGSNVIMTKSDVNVINDSNSTKNVSDLRTQILVAPSNNTNHFENVWKSPTGQGKTFSNVYSVTDKSEIQERALLHSTANIDDTSGVLVQKRDKRAAEVENVDSATTITTTIEENSVSEHVGHPDALAPDTNDSWEYEQCLAPEYIVYTWVLCLVALATALKLYYLVKTTLATVMVSVFTTLILVAYREVLDNE
jgi:membrane protein implicated in regulation of membrane protease activity